MELMSLFTVLMISLAKSQYLLVREPAIAVSHVFGEGPALRGRIIALFEDGVV